MLTTTCRPPAEAVTLVNPVPEDDVRACVRVLLRGLTCRDRAIDRRGERRYPYPYLVRLTPVAEDGVTPEGDSVVVVGKHLSERGVGFYHSEPLAHRRMIASLETQSGGWLSLLIDLNWCRFTGHHRWYESGGRFLETVETPIGPDD